MASKTALAAGVLSLILVGTWEKAQAETTPVNSDYSPGVITIFGKTLCNAQASPMMQCDWRIPDLSKTPVELGH